MALASPWGCDRGAPQKLFRVARGVMALAVDDERLCWVTGPEHGRLFVAKRDSGPANPKHHNLEWARDLTLFGEQAYLAVATGVVRAPLHGGPLLELASQSNGAQRLVVDPSGVFWLERQTGALWSLAHDGAGPAKPRQLATGPSWASAIAVDVRHVYWTAGEAGLLHRVPKAGGEARVLHRADQPLTDLVCDGERLYWCTATEVMGMELGGGTPEVLARDQAGPTALAVSRSVLCWVTGQRLGQAGSGGITAMPKRVGATPRAITRGTIVQALALAGNALYWADHDTRGIMRASVGT